MEKMLSDKSATITERRQFAEKNCMSMDFVNWFFDEKKEGCGNAWFIMGAAMWEGWKGRANREAQPVMWAHERKLSTDVAITKDATVAAAWESEGLNVTPLYTDPPAPAVPGIDELRLTFERSERESDDGFNLHKYGIGYADEATQARWESWLSCRAAMLAQPVSGGYTLNSPEIPDGWVACSERMPEEGDVVLVCQEGGIIYCAEMQDGELYPDEFPRVPSEGREITHWMPLPAAPEVRRDDA